MIEPKIGELYLAYGCIVKITKRPDGVFLAGPPDGEPIVWVKVLSSSNSIPIFDMHPKYLSELTPLEKVKFL